MKKISALAAIAAVGLAASAQGQSIFTADFNTDQSGDFNVLAWDLFNTPLSQAEDFTIDFNFDSSTIAPSGPGTPGPAPGSTDTNVLRVNVNTTDDNGGSGEAVGVNVVPILPSPYDSGLGTADWTLTFDIWAFGGGGGSTIFAGAGASDGTVANWSSVAVTDGSAGTPDGFNYGATGEGGALSDYVYYDGCPTCADDGSGNVFSYKPNQPAWWGTDPAVINGGDTEWTDYFAPTATFSAGMASGIWNTVTMSVSYATDPATVSISFEAVGNDDGGPTEVANFQVSENLISTDFPFLNVFDVFASVTELADVTLVLYDNVEIVVDTPASVDQWQMY